MKLPILLTLTVLFPFLGFAQIATDPTFNSGNAYIFSDGNSGDYINDMAIDNQGRVILVGNTNFDPDESDNSRGVVIRLNTNGLPDETFAPNGKLYIDFPNSSDLLYGVILDQQNNIYVSGRTNIVDGGVFKISAATNQLDAAFGTNGRAVFQLTGTFYDIVVTPNGKLIVCGNKLVDGDFDYFIAFYNPNNGTLDLSQGGSDGYATAGSAEDEWAVSLAIQADGKILVGGYEKTGASDNTNNPTFLRFNSDGTFDNGMGIKVESSAVNESYNNDIATRMVGTEERILICGVHEPSVNDFAGFVSSKRSNGNNSSGDFGSSVGFKSLPTFIRITDIEVTPDGKVYLIGYEYYFDQNNEFNARIRVNRYNADLSEDGSFGTGSSYNYQVSGYYNTPRVIKVIGSKFYVAGYSQPDAANFSDADGFCIRFSGACTTGPTASLSATNTTCGLANGSLTATVSTGLPPYTYLWSNGQSTQTISNLAVGTYSVTVKDADGCSTVLTQSVTATPVLTFNVNTTPAKCGLSNGTGSVVVSGGPAIVSYSWSNGSTSNPAINLPSGPNAVTVLDANGCSSTSTFTIAALPIVSINITNNATTCGLSNGSATVNILNNVAVSSFLWNTGAITHTIGNLAAGTYTCTVNDANGCTAVATTVINASSAPSINLGPDLSILSGQTTNFDATTSGASAYSWSTGATTATIAVSSSGTYCVTVTTAGNCTASDCVNLDVLSSSSDLGTLGTIEAFPNPVDEILTIKFPNELLNSPIIVRIYDAKGRLVFQKNTNPSSDLYSIDLGNLAGGIYWLSLSKGVASTQIKFIKN
jgi:uncharacterized delta-60 repeat protein